MANKKISELPAATLPLAGTELMEIVQGGINKQVAKSDVGSAATADPTTPGIMKLYTTTGVNTDGTMDQNSITLALAAINTDTDFFYISAFRTLYNY